MRELRLSDRENCSALRRLARTSWAAGCARPRSDWRAGPRWTVGTSPSVVHRRPGAAGRPLAAGV